MRPYFLFNAPNWTPASAGVRSLHLLCHMVNETGQRGYLTPCVKNPTLNTPIWHSGLKGKPIIIYPEGIHGNPFGIKTVVRWLLYHQNHDFVSLNSDLFFSWSSTYDRNDVLSVPLRIPIIDETAFSPPKDLNVVRDLKCFFGRKYLNGGGIISQEILDTCIDVDSYPAGDKKGLTELFRRSQYLVLYEHSTCTEEAMLCGCPTVYIESEFFKEFPPDNNTMGVALSFDPKAIQQANETLIDRMRMYMRMKKESEFQVKRFIEYCLEAV